MPSVKAEIEVACPASGVYTWLRDRYSDPRFRAVCRMAKGYEPVVERLSADAHERLAFRVAGRDPILRCALGAWEWSYDLTAVSAERTRVAIRYRWSAWLSFLACGTAGHQAANEIGETATGLIALEQGAASHGGEQTGEHGAS